MLAEITVTGAVDDGAGEGDRAPHRDLAAREDRALRPRRELGPRADGRGLARRGTAATRTIDAGAGHARATTARSSSTRGAPTDVEPDVAGPSCTIELDLGLGDGQRGLPDERPLLRLRPHQRGLPDMSRIVVKVGGAVAARVGGGGARARARATRCASSTAPARRSAPRWSAPGIPVEFVGGRRVTTAEGHRDRARARSRPSTRRSGPRSASARCRSSATRSACAPSPVPELGLVGDPIAAELPRARAHARRRGGSR